MTIKRRRARGQISSFSGKKDENNIEINTDLNQAKDKYLLQL